MRKAIPNVAIRKPPPPAVIDNFVSGTPHTVNGPPSTACDTRSTASGLPSTANGGPNTVDVDGSPDDDDDSGPSTVNGAPSTIDHIPFTVDVDRRRRPEPWEATHQRATFHVPRALLKLLEKESRRSDKSKSRIVVEALMARLHTAGQA